MGLRSGLVAKWLVAVVANFLPSNIAASPCLASHEKISQSHSLAWFEVH